MGPIQGESGSLALKLDFQKPEDYISIVYYYISEI